MALSRPAPRHGGVAHGSSSSQPEVAEVEVAVDPHHLLRGALLTVALLVAYVGSRRFLGIDLEVYRLGAKAMLAHRNPYVQGLAGSVAPYSYTPFSTVLFVPLHLLSLPAALGAMTFLSLVAMWWSVRVLLTGAFPEWDRIRLEQAAAAVCALALLTEPITENLGFGQVNLILMALVVTDLLVVRHESRRGWLVGFATGVKLTPGIFIAYLVVTRRYRAALNATLATVATVAIGWLAMPAGSRSYWLDGVGADPHHIGDTQYLPNQSLLGSLSRIVGGYAVARPWWLAAAVPVAVGGLWLASRARQRWGEAEGVAITAATGLVVSPVSWSHHWVWYLVPAVLLGARVVHDRGRPAGAALTGLVLSVALSPFWWIPESRRRTTHHSALESVLGSWYTIVAIVGLGLTAAVMFRSSTRRR